ncbi:MAG: DUF6596 domain-containing protein, partial [Azonexus sp.]
RLQSVLAVVYLIFNEGYAATAGDAWMRPTLCEDALRLGRILAELAPQEPEVHGLIALMEIQASRLRARSGPNGMPILLLAQNRARWDHLLIGRGFAALERAEKLGGARGPYALQAAIAACHARAHTPETTDWARLVMPTTTYHLTPYAYAMQKGDDAWLARIERFMSEAKRNGQLLATVKRHKLDPIAVTE